MKLCIFTLTFRSLCIFWHAIPTSSFIFNDFSFLFTIYASMVVMCGSDPTWLTFAFVCIVCILFNSLVLDHTDVFPDPRTFNSQPAGLGEESGHVLEGKSEEKVLSKQIITGTGWSLWWEGNGTVERELRITRTPQSWCCCFSASNTWTYLIS